jgi:hypothetical protein
VWSCLTPPFPTQSTLSAATPAPTGARGGGGLAQAQRGLRGGSGLSRTRPALVFGLCVDPQPRCPDSLLPSSSFTPPPPPRACTHSIGQLICSRADSLNVACVVMAKVRMGAAGTHARGATRRVQPGRSQALLSCSEPAFERTRAPSLGAPALLPVPAAPCSTARAPSERWVLPTGGSTRRFERGLKVWVELCQCLWGPPKADCVEQLAVCQSLLVGAAPLAWPPARLTLSLGGRRPCRCHPPRARAPKRSTMYSLAALLPCSTQTRARPL